MAVRVRGKTLVEMSHDVVEGAQGAEQIVSSAARITHATGFIATTTNVVSGQSDLMAYFGSLLDKVSILVQVGDEIAKARTFL